MSPKTTLALLAALAALSLVPPSGAQGQTPQDLRSDALAALTALHGVAVALGHEPSAAALERARVIVEGLEEEELARIQHGGPRLPELASAAEALRIRIEADGDRTPGAAALGAVDFPAAPYSGLCGSERTGTGVLYGALLVFQAAESAREGASRGCDETVVVAGEGGNAALACLVLDIAWAAAKGFYEGLEFCDVDIDRAEILGSYERAGHLHDDLAEHDADIKGRLAQHDADIKARLDAIDGKLGELRGLMLRLAREEAMTTATAGHNQNIGLFESEHPDGIDATRALVLETIETSEARQGKVLKSARRNLARGDAARADGDLTRAYVLYRRAYESAVR